MRKEGDDAELVLFVVVDTSMVVVILGISPPLSPPPATPAAAASSRSSALVAAPALLGEDPNDTHVDASSSPLPSLSVRSSSGSKVCALL